MAEIDGTPISGQVYDIDDLQPYINLLFLSPTPWPAGSQPLLLVADTSSQAAMSELDIFRVMASVLTHGITTLYNAYCDPHAGTGPVNMDLMTSGHVDHIHACFRATGYDFLMDPPANHSLLSRCLPQGQAPKCIKIPRTPAKTSWATVLIHPLPPA